VPLSRQRDYLSIGEVLEAIRPEFPDVSISKIRFLENEGLIAPARTGSGYRKFYEPDVARLRYILSLQRDQFLPLKVIRERLTEWESDGSPPEQGQRSAPESPSGAPPGEGEVRLTRLELMEAAGLSEEQLVGLEDYSILPRGREAYGADDLAVARAAVGLFDFGIEPRHLRMFHQSAEREADVLSQVVAPLAQRRDAEARAEAPRAIERMTDLTTRLRAALLRCALRDRR
jgi:DNA-binding transcriptional MerR regulator